MTDHAGGRIDAVQGLRALAVVLVVAYHLEVPVGAGFVGVDIFFVISGFVITRMVLRRTTATGRLDLRAFWAGRVRRLLPALWVVLLGTLVGSVLLTSPFGSQSAVAATAAGAAVWASNGVLALQLSDYFADGTAANPLLHTWSLAVEEQFYVLFPLVIVWAAWRGRRTGVAGPVVIGRYLAVAGVLSFVLTLVLTYVPLPLPVGPLLAFYSPVTRAWEFAAGALLAVAFHRGWVPGRWARASIPLGLSLLLLGLLVIEGGQRFPGWIATLPVGATVLLVIGAVRGTRGVAWLAARPVTYLGDISYSWYLTHWPVVVFATGGFASDASWRVLLLAGAAGLLLAVLCHHLVEQPVRSGRRLPRVGAPALVGAVVVTTFVASAAVHVGARVGWGDPELAAAQQSFDHDRWKVQKACQSIVPLTDRSYDDCRIEGSSGGRPIVLVGDSNAGVYADMLASVGRRLDRTTTVATVPSCALVDVVTLGPGGTSWLDCAEYYRTSMQWLDRQPASVVLVAGAVVTPDLDGFDLREPDGTIVSGAEAQQRALQRSLARTFERLRAMGHEVVSVELAPHFYDWNPSRCTMLSIVREGVEECGAALPREAADSAQRRSLEAEREAAASAEVERVEVRDELCPGGTCRTNEGDRWTYEDGVHFQVRGGPRLTCPNVAGARVPVYEVFAEDAYRLGWFLQGLRDDAAVVDVGGHIGCFSVAVALARPQARVWTFEASPTTAAYTRRNVADNGLADRVEVANVAVSDRVGVLSFADNAGGSGLNGVTAPVGTATIDVPCIDLAEALRRGDGVEVVKIDTEGAEYDIVLGSSPSDWAGVQRLVMEYHEVPGRDWAELRGFLESAGLQVAHHEPVTAQLGTVWFSRSPLPPVS